MTIRENPDKDYVEKVRDKLKSNSGYCPCRIEKTDDTKCMCKEFRDSISSGKFGMCHCGLYVAFDENSSEQINY